jgi:activating molecule in BECN1-regulated autophagy protein 1
VSLFTSFFF